MLVHIAPTFSMSHDAPRATGGRNTPTTDADDVLGATGSTPTTDVLGATGGRTINLHRR